MVDIAAILAGGRSKRMGRDKAFIEVDGVPLVRRTAHVVEECGVEKLHLIGNQQRLHGFGFPVIQDVSSEQHPLFGVAAALQLYPTDLILILPCDLVNLQAHHLQSLLRHNHPCVARSNGRIHPLLGVFPGTLATEAERLAKAGSAAAKLISDFPTVDVPNPILIDANLPAHLPR